MMRFRPRLTYSDRLPGYAFIAPAPGIIPVFTLYEAFGNEDDRNKHIEI